MNLYNKLYQEISRSKLFLLYLFIHFFLIFITINILHPRFAVLRRTKFTYHSFTPGYDYTANYSAASALVSGYNIYQDNRQYGEKFTDPHAERGKSRFIYPPLIAYIVAPFTQFSFYTSYILWILFNLLVLIITIYLLSIFVDYPVSAFIFLLAAYFTSSSLYAYIELGQFDIIVFFFFVLSLYFYHIRKNNILSALFLAIATGLKVYPAIFLFYCLAKRKYSVICYTLLFGIAMLFLTGINNWIACFKALSQFSALSKSALSYSWWYNHSVSSLFLSIAHFLGNNIFFKPLYYGFILASLAFLFFIFNTRDQDFILEISSLSILMTLIPSVSFDHNLVAMGFVFLSVFIYLKDNIQSGTSFYKTTFIILLLIVIIISRHFEAFFFFEYGIIGRIFLRLKIITLISILFFNLAYNYYGSRKIQSR